MQKIHHKRTKKNLSEREREREKHGNVAFQNDEYFVKDEMNQFGERENHMLTSPLQAAKI